MTSAPVSLSASGPLARQWLAVACPTDVEESPAAVKVLGRDLVLWRSPDGTVVAAPDRCTHSKGDLTKGELKDGLLACPKHGWTFGDEGRCVFKPSGLPINERAHLKTHHCTERYGLIWVSLADPAESVVDFGWDGDDSHQMVHRSVSTWHSNPIEIMGALLMRSDSLFDDVTAELPFVLRGNLKSSDGIKHRLLLSCAPVDNRNSLVTSVVWTSNGATADDGIVTTVLADLDAAKAEAESKVTPIPTVEITPGESSDAADWKHRLLALYGQTVT